MLSFATHLASAKPGPQPDCQWGKLAAAKLAGPLMLCRGPHGWSPCELSQSWWQGSSPAPLVRCRYHPPSPVIVMTQTVPPHCQTFRSPDLRNVLVFPQRANLFLCPPACSTPTPSDAKRCFLSCSFSHYFLISGPASSSPNAAEYLVHRGSGQGRLSVPSSPSSHDGKTKTGRKLARSQSCILSLTTTTSQAQSIFNVRVFEELGF